MVVKQEILHPTTCDINKLACMNQKCSSSGMWGSTITCGDTGGQNRVTWNELSSCRIDWFNNKSNKSRSDLHPAKYDKPTVNGNILPPTRHGHMLETDSSNFDTGSLCSAVRGSVTFALMLRLSSFTVVSLLADKKQLPKY